MKSLNEKDLKSIVGGAYVCTYQRIYWGSIYIDTSWKTTHYDYYMGMTKSGLYKYGKPWL